MKNKTFEEHPLYWLLFSTTAISSLILVKLILERLFNQKNLVLEVMAPGVWLALYLSMLGPLINKFFWPFEDLYFSFKFGPFFILLIGYFMIRVL